MAPTVSFRTGIGLAAIATYEPAWRLENQWFGGALARKFVHHTGTESRLVSARNEVSMACRAVENLRRETACDLRDCAAIVFASPSFVPPKVARKLLGARAARKESLPRAAREFALQLGLENCPIYALNWFCSGYAKALSVAKRQVVPLVGLRQNEFVLVVTSSRISRITDFGCAQSGPLFGDLATATLLSRVDSPKYPVHFQLLYAHAERQPAAGVFFNYALKENVLAPAPHGGETRAERRLVFQLDGMGIADVAPRAMSHAVAKALETKGLRAADLQFVVPHQAGTGIVRLATMKFEQLGISGEVINGITSGVGNVSSCSIPYALRQTWQRLEGTITCPTAAVGAPGQAEVSQGCILLRSMPGHRQSALAS